MKEVSHETLMKMYDAVTPVVRGYAVASHNGKMFHILPDGRPLYDERFDWVDSPFFEGRARVMDKGVMFHIFPTGKPAYDYGFEWVGHYLNGVAGAQHNGKMCRINKSGHKIAVAA